MNYDWPQVAHPFGPVGWFCVASTCNGCLVGWLAGWLVEAGQWVSPRKLLADSGDYDDLLARLWVGCPRQNVAFWIAYSVARWSDHLVANRLKSKLMLETCRNFWPVLANNRALVKPRASNLSSRSYRSSRSSRGFKSRLSTLEGFHFARRWLKLHALAETIEPRAIHWNQQAIWWVYRQQQQLLAGHANIFLLPKLRSSLWTQMNI